jgi:glutamate-1-semialdehyde 2,1-aminomutase
MGNGFPVSAFGGRADVMEQVATNRAMHAGTYNGGGISVAAGLATTSALASDPDAYERMRALGRRLMDGLMRLGEEHGHRIVAQGPGPVFFAWFLDEGEVKTYRDHLRADFARYARFAAAMLSQGVRLIPAGRWYLTCAHGTAEIDRALEAADAALARLER